MSRIMFRHDEAVVIRKVVNVRAGTAGELS